MDGKSKRQTRCDPDEVKVHTLVRSKGEKMWPQPAPDYDALDVANKAREI